MSTPPSTRPLVVLFDADGVLQRPGPTWRRDLAALISPAGSGRLEEFLAEVSAAEAPTLTGRADFVDTMQPVLDAWRVRSPAREVLALWDDIVVEPEMIAAVRELTGTGIRCALGTNQHAQRAAYMRAALDYGSAFDPLFYSCEIGRAKPATDFFAYAVAALGCEPGEVLFVDDNQANVTGAEGAGLRAERFTPYGGVDELRRILHAHELD